MLYMRCSGRSRVPLVPQRDVFALSLVAPFSLFVSLSIGLLSLYFSVSLSLSLPLSATELGFPIFAPIRGFPLKSEQNPGTSTLFNESYSDSTQLATLHLRARCGALPCDAWIQVPPRSPYS